MSSVAPLHCGHCGVQRGRGVACQPCYPIAAAALLAAAAFFTYQYSTRNLRAQSPNGGPFCPPISGAAALNYTRLRQSLDHGRNVIPADQIAAFIDPANPITNHFTHVKLLGTGNHGSVSLWLDSEGNPFAIKALSSRYKCAGNREFEMGLALDHPNIVRMHNCVCKLEGNDHHHYVIMEFVDGPSADMEIPDEHRLTLLGEALDGLDHILGRGIKPRDLAMRNMLLTSDSHWKFADFGLYERIDGGGTCCKQIVTSLDFFITRFASPAQRASKDPIWVKITETFDKLGLLRGTAMTSRQATSIRLALNSLRTFVRQTDLTTSRP